VGSRARRTDRRDTEIIFLAFGNPTLNTGAFREVFGKHRALWNTKQIDSRTVEGTNKAYLDELVATYGIDSDIVKVRVLGQFPSASSMQFIASDGRASARCATSGTGWAAIPSSSASTARASATIIRRSRSAAAAMLALVRGSAGIKWTP
jgi:hypothetical protein